MLRIEQGKPWVMWPNSLVDNFIEFPANRILDYSGDFKIQITFELEKIVNQKSTLFAKLPSYFGIDLEEKGISLLVTPHGKLTKYIFAEFLWELNVIYNLVIDKHNNIITILVNSKPLITFTIEDKLSSDTNSHIILGAGNFPENDFNLNYLEVVLHKFYILKDNNLISKHNFNTFIHNKSFDETENCNFIHKI